MDSMSEDILLTQYISTSRCSPTKTKYLPLHMQKCVKSLTKIDDEINQKLSRITKSIGNTISFSPSQYDRVRYTHKVCFIICKFLNIFLKYQSLRYTQLTQARKKINDFKNLISDNLDKNILIQIQLSDFLKAIFEKVEKSVTRLEFKLRSLYHYANNLQNVERDRIFTNNEIAIEMKRLSNKIDLKNNYIRPSKFDQMLEIYIESNRELHINFLRIININNHTFPKRNTEKNVKHYPTNKHQSKKSSQETTNLILNDFDFFMNMLSNKLYSRTQESAHTASQVDQARSSPFIISNPQSNTDSSSQDFNFPLFELLIQKVYTQITGREKINPEMFIVLRCSALRYLCDKHYVNYTNKWIEMNDQIYIQNCIKTSEQTPRELQISTEIIPDKFADTCFRELFTGDDFVRAKQSLFLLNFFVCPIDAWSRLQVAIELALSGAGKLAGKPSSRANIAFDDFLSIVIPVFAEAQVSCPRSLQSLFERFRKFEKTNSTNIASLLAVTLTSYFLETK